jgi:vesicle transport through interaction with t-SNAREs 1
MEARSAPLDQSRPLLQKVKDYRADLGKLKDDVKRAAAAGPPPMAARAELGLADSYYDTSAGQRDRLLTATERLGRTSERLHTGRQQLLETEVRWKSYYCFVSMYFFRQFCTCKG